jgi:hypothetical protein
MNGQEKTSKRMDDIPVSRLHGDADRSQSPLSNPASPSVRFPTHLYEFRYSLAQVKQGRFYLHFGTPSAALGAENKLSAQVLSTLHGTCHMAHGTWHMAHGQGKTEWQVAFATWGYRNE